MYIVDFLYYMMDNVYKENKLCDTELIDLTRIDNL